MAAPKDTFINDISKDIRSDKDRLNELLIQSPNNGVASLVKRRKQREQWGLTGGAPIGAPTLSPPAAPIEPIPQEDIAPTVAPTEPESIFWPSGKFTGISPRRAEEIERRRIISQPRTPIALRKYGGLSPLAGYTEDLERWTSQESKIKDIWDALYLGVSQAWYGTRQGILNVVPQAFVGGEYKGSYEDRPAQFKPMTPETWESRKISHNKAVKALQESYDRREAEFQIWLGKHPELKPRPKYTQSPIEHPELLKDPAYYFYIMASQAPLIGSALVVGLATTYATQNPWAGAVTGAAVLTPAQIDDIYSQLLEAGADPSNAAELATGVGVVIGAIEIVPGMITLKAVSPAMMKMFNKELSKELSEQVVTKLTAKGILSTAGKIEIAETIEEVLQETVSNAAIRTIDSNRSLIEGLPEVAIQSAISVLPLAGLGGSSQYLAMKSNLSPEIQTEIDETATRMKGFGLSEDHAQAVSLGKVLETEEGRAQVQLAQEKVTRAQPPVSEKILSLQEVLNKVRTGKPLNIGETRFMANRVADKIIAREQRLTSEEAQFFANDPDAVESAIKTRTAVIPTAPAPEVTPLTAEEVIQGVTEPQEMTQSEFRKVYPGAGADAVHRSAVFGAVNQGKPVSSEVLKDYPDLAERVKEVSIPTTEPTPAPEGTIPDITRKGIPIGEGLDQTFARQLADGTFQVTPSYNLVSKGFERKIFNTQEEAKAYINELQKAIAIPKAKVVTPTTPVTPEVTEKLAQVPKMRAQLWAEAESLGISGEDFIAHINRKLPETIGDDFTVKLYRGVTTPRREKAFETFIEGESGRWWSTSIERARSYTKGIGDLYEVEVKVSELLNPELTGVARQAGEKVWDEVTLVGTIQKRAKLYSVAIPKEESGMPEAGLQPSMLPEEVAAREVRPAGKGKVVQISMEDQLKLEQARRAAEEATEEVREAYEAQAEAEGIKYTLATDPIANLRFKVGNRSYSIDNIVDAKEKTFAANDSFILSQAKAIKPKVVFSGRNKLPNGRIRADAVLDELAQKYTGGDVDAFIDRVNEIRRLKNELAVRQETIMEQMTKTPVRLEKETGDISDLIEVRGEPLYTIEQIDALSGIMGEYLVNPNTVNAYQVVRQYQSLERARRFKNVASRRQELIVTEGLSWEEAHNKAMGEFASGPLPSFTIEGLEDITAELRDVLFAKVNHTFSQLGEQYEGERWATITALTNALAGTPIPMDKGKGSLLFPEGGSAWDRLNYVFGKQPRLTEGLTKTAKQKKSLKDVIQGIFREVPEGGMPPIQIDEKMAAYLRNLSLVYDQIRLGGLPAELQFQIIEDVENLPSDLKVEDSRTDKRTPAQRALELVLFKIEMAKPPTPVAKFDAPIETVFKQPAFKGWTVGEKQMIVRVLKEAGLTVVDIGNLIRANVASFDNSFLRQSKVLATGHPLIGAAGHQTAWQSMFSPKHAEADWQLITRDPDYAIYEEVRARSGADPLRVPAFVNEKGTERYRRAEEYGFPGGERFIPRLTTKIPWIKLSERAFVAGTNKIVWGVWKAKLRLAHRMAEKIASGEMKLAEGEGFDIIQEMVDHQKMLANFIQRASLGRIQGLAPEMSAIFFAARSKLGRWFFPIHLTGLSVQNKQVRFNPRVMREAWRDFILMNVFWGGLMFLGDWLNLWDTEKDPRNAEFMSARIGKIRIDPWAGYRQFVVLYARLVTGTGVSSVTGAEYEVNKIGALVNFIRNSFGPMASTFVDFWTGRNFLGQVVEITNGKQWLERVMPFLIQDVWDAYEEEGIKGAAIAVVPGIYGEGVQTYTGEWEDNWQKLGMPKYLENTAYGLTDPKYDTADFWADTSSQFKGVDPATLTKEKGFPEYIRAIVEVRVINEHLETLPNKVLTKINADPAEGPTFVDYYNQWKTREGLVAAGDEALWQTTELQPDGTYKKITHKGDKAVEAFDKDEATKNANNGNISQTQFVLLNQYWLIKDKKQRELFADKNIDEIGINPRLNYLETHPKENAQLAVWGPEQAKILTDKAYDEFKKLNKKLDIPESAISQDIERTEDDLKLLTYWKLPSSPTIIREDYRRQNLLIDAILVKWYGYTPIVLQQPSRPATSKKPALSLPGVAPRTETIRERLTRAGLGK